MENIGLLVLAGVIVVLLVLLWLIGSAMYAIVGLLEEHRRYHSPRQVRLRRLRKQFRPRNRFAKQMDR